MPKRSLPGLLKLLREQGVSKFKGDGFEIEFGHRAHFEKPIIKTPIDDDGDIPTQPAKKKTPEEIENEILFHSAGG